tara:strand:+ start:585 stop:1004 length:420 start_codon:yes stop_codon:yes gene_type:complete
MDKSIGGKLENNGIFFRSMPETKLTAAIVKVPVIKLTTKKIGRYSEFLSLKPSNNEFPVEAVKRVPTSKKGYFNKFVKSIRPSNENPNLAPAVVDDIKCDPPIAAPAKIMPGPITFFRFDLIRSNFFFQLKIYSLLLIK